MLKRVILYILIIFPFSLIAQQKSNIYLTGTYNGVSFAKFATDVEEKYPIKFYYKQAWADTTPVSLELDSTLLEDALHRIFLTTPLHYVVLPPARVYLLPNSDFVAQLPAYIDTEESTTVSGNGEQSLTAMEQKYLKGRKADVMETIVVGANDKAQNGKSPIISGKIIDNETGEPLIGATMYIEELKSGTATDAFGNLTMALKKGKYTALFQSLGMEDLKVLLDVRSAGYFSIDMKKEVTSIAEVTVNADKSFKRGSRVGLEKVSIKSIKELPTLMGEKDVLKISQMLPGVVSVGEGSAGVNVRGGNVDQNLFYINDVPVYNTSHLFGFFSAINSSIINNFSIYKGHVPADYGGRLSSVFNIETRRGNKRKFFTQGGISPISANVALEAPVVKDKVSVLFSARSSYSDWILNRIEDPNIRNSEVLFYDFAGSVNYDINEKNQINAFGYNSYDFFSLNKQTDYEYANTGGAISYLHLFNPALKLNASVIGSRYYFKTTEEIYPVEAYEHDYDLRHFETKAKLTYTINEKHTVSGGITNILYNLNRGVVEPYGLESLRKPVNLGKEQGIESAFYLDENFKVNNWLKLYGGIRYSFFNELGPKTVYGYNQGSNRDERTIIDTSHYNQGEIISSMGGPELRFAADFRINSFNSVKLSFTQMRQYLFMLSNTISVAPNDQWKLIDSHMLPPKSKQYSIGYYHDIPAWSMNVTGEAYYKMAENVVEYKDGADFLSTPKVETTLLQGDQKAFGFEFMVAKNEGKFNGWISYAYSRSKIQVTGENNWEKINNGIEFPSNYDKPHVLSVIGNYKVNRRFTLSTNVSYSTGRPVTLPESSFYIENEPYIDYSARNVYRLPDYFRIDMSLTIEGNLKVKKPLHSYWMISVYNMLGRDNVHSIYFQTEEGRLMGYKYSVIGVPIFTVSWNFKLGNYTND